MRFSPPKEPLPPEARASSVHPPQHLSERGGGITPSNERSQTDPSLARSATRNVVGSTTATSNRSFLVLRRTEHISSIRRFHTFTGRANQSISERWRIDHDTPNMLSKLSPISRKRTSSSTENSLNAYDKLIVLFGVLWDIPSVTTSSSGNSETTVSGRRPTKQLDRTNLFVAPESTNTRNGLDAPFSNAQLDRDRKRVPLTCDGCQTLFACVRDIMRTATLRPSVRRPRVG